MVKINELRPFMKKVDVIGKIIEINEIREVQSKLDNSSHKVTEAKMADETGSVLLTLWDDAISNIEQDKDYKITNGYTSLFKNSLRLNIGRYGTIAASDEPITEPNTENNLSDKEFEMRRPRREF